MSRQTKDDVYECALDAMVKDKRRVKSYPLSGLMGSIKYPWHIFPMVRRFLDQSQKYIAPSARISEKAIIEGKVLIRDNVRVFRECSNKGARHILGRSL